MTQSVRISFHSSDRIGLIAAVTARLFDLGGDLGDTSYTVLGEGADFSTVCDFADDLDLEAIRAELEAIPELSDATELVVAPFVHPTLKGPTGMATHRITVIGGNRPGLVARMSEALIDYHANVVRLATEVVPGSETADYVIRMAVSIPAEKTYTCLSTLDAIAQQLSMEMRVETV